MSNYYFLAASLPPLELGSRPDITFEELKARLALNLKKEDQEKVARLLRLVDIQNMRSLFLKEPLDPRGNLNEKELDEALLIHNILPLYVFDFLDQYDSTKEKIKHFFGLFSRYFQNEIPEEEGFLKRYLTFEREWRLVLVALRAKQFKRDLVKELQFEDFRDPFVAQILAQKDTERYEPPQEYQELTQLLAAADSDPWQLHKAFAAWRFERIEELTQAPLFSIDWILAYMAKLMIVEYWNELDAEKGKNILDTFKNG